METLSITSEPGENIPNFNAKIRDLCEAIKKCGPAPMDLNLLVMKHFVDCSVTILAQHVNTKYFELRQDPSKHPSRDTLDLHASMYYQLRDMWTPEASRPITNKEFQNFVKSNTTSMYKLQIAGGQSKKGTATNNPNSRADPNSNSDSKKQSCWDFGKPDVI